MPPSHAVLRPGAGQPKRSSAICATLKSSLSCGFGPCWPWTIPNFSPWATCHCTPPNGDSQEGDGLPLDPDRWAEERQYLRHDTGAALGAFGRRRAETLTLLRKLTSAQWQRGSIHPTLGRMTCDDWVTLIVAHDANHVDQLQRAVRGQP